MATLFRSSAGWPNNLFSALKSNGGFPQLSPGSCQSGYGCIAASGTSRNERQFSAI
jgi:hypothetical protein